MRELIFEGGILRLVIVDGKWEVVEHAAAVAVLVTRGTEVLGVSQPRVAVDRTTWELPAGLIDPGETPEQAAARELREEVQLSGSLRLLSRFYVSPGFTDEEVFLYELEEPKAAAGTPDPDEELTPLWRDAEEAWRAVQEGALATSAVTVVGLRHVLARQGVQL